MKSKGVTIPPSKVAQTFWTTNETLSAGFSIFAENSVVTTPKPAKFNVGVLSKKDVTSFSWAAVKPVMATVKGRVPAFGSISVTKMLLAGIVGEMPASSEASSDSNAAELKVLGSGKSLMVKATSTECWADTAGVGGGAVGVGVVGVGAVGVGAVGVGAVGVGAVGVGAVG